MSVENRDFFHARPAFDAPVRGGPRHNIAITFGLGILEWRGYWLPDNQKTFDNTFRRFNTIQACDGQT